MVTPVHRFQSVECAVGAPRRSHSHNSHHAQRHAAHYNILPAYPTQHLPSLSTYGITPTSITQPTSRRADPDSAVYLDMPDNSSSGSSQPAAMMPPFPHVPLMPSHVKCGMWASFALATVFVAGAKFYFDHQLARSLQGTGLEVLVLFALLVVVLLGACAVSLCRTRDPQPMTQPIRVSSTGVHDPDAVNRDSNDDLVLGTILSLQSQSQTTVTGAPSAAEPPPPPYHIAVLLPQRNRGENGPAHPHRADVPPPTYEKAVS